MRSITERIWLFITYFFQKIDEHSLQAPFSFSFYTQIIKDRSFQPNRYVEELRKTYFQSKDEIEYQTFGKTSKLSKKSRAKVSEIARHGISSFKKSCLFHNIIRHFDHKIIFELGTSLGLNACYLSDSVQSGMIYTFEGHPRLCEMARENFQKLGVDNLVLIEGNIDQTLSKSMRDVPIVDFIFIDANHQSEKVITYFNLLSSKVHDRSVMIIDDIRWSLDMYRGWQRIINSPLVSHSFDLGSLGIITFEKNLTRQNFILEF